MYFVENPSDRHSLTEYMHPSSQVPDDREAALAAGLRSISTFEALIGADRIPSICTIVSMHMDPQGSSENHEMLEIRQQVACVFRCADQVT